MQPPDRLSVGSHSGSRAGVDVLTNDNTERYPVVHMHGGSAIRRR